MAMEAPPAAVHPEAKLFVGQLMPSVTRDDLYARFSSYGAVKSCTLLINHATGKSKGCGMVTFEKWASAEAALEAEDGGTSLSGDRKLVVKFADPVRREDGRFVGITPKKLFVGQVPLTASEADLREMFEPYGSVTHVHVIHNKGSASMGAAFVTFERWSAAEAAMEALGGKVKLANATTPLVVRFADGKFPSAAHAGPNGVAAGAGGANSAVAGKRHSGFESNGGAAPSKRGLAGATPGMAMLPPGAIMAGAIMAGGGYPPAMGPAGGMRGYLGAPPMMVGVPMAGGGMVVQAPGGWGAGGLMVSLPQPLAVHQQQHFPQPPDTPQQVPYARSDSSAVTLSEQQPLMPQHPHLEPNHGAERYASHAQHMYHHPAPERGFEAAQPGSTPGESTAAVQAQGNGYHAVNDSGGRSAAMDVVPHPNGAAGSGSPSRQAVAGPGPGALMAPHMYSAMGMVAPASLAYSPYGHMAMAMPHGMVGAMNGAAMAMAGTSSAGAGRAPGGGHSRRGGSGGSASVLNSISVSKAQLEAAKEWKLFLGQISFDLDVNDLKPFFSQFGTILELALLRQADGRSKGIGFLTYSSSAEAEAAVAGANNAVLPNDPRGRRIVVKFA